MRLRYQVMKLPQRPQPITEMFILSEAEIEAAGEL